MAKPEHVEESEHGRMCRHCCGTVDADGYALGEQEQFAPFEGEETEQQSSTVAMRENSGASFARAVKGYAEGGMVHDAGPDGYTRPDKVFDEGADGYTRQDKAFDAGPDGYTKPDSDEELKSRKAARYAGLIGRWRKSGAGPTGASR